MFFRVLKAFTSSFRLHPFLARVALFDGGGEDEHADDADDGGGDEGNGGGELPERGADGRRRGDRKTGHEGTEPDGARAHLWRGEIHDHRLARGLAVLAQAPDDEGRD